MQYKIAQLIVTPGQKSSTTSEIFVAQPDANKEALVGKLFALIEFESKKVNDLKIINFLIENLNNNYYQNEKMVLRERVKTVKIEHIFESALAKTNKNLDEFLRSEKIKLNPKLINATVGVIYENSLHFANLGKNKTFLIYPAPRQSKNIKTDRGVYKNLPEDGLDEKNNKNYNITNVSQHAKISEKKSQINITKLFSSVISGSIPDGGYFIFTNEALPEYLSNKQIVEIITTLPPASAAEQIKNSLEKINYYVSFLGLIVKNTSGHDKEILKKEITESPRDSISNLNKVEEATDELLTPAGLINFKKWFGFLPNIISKLNFGSSGLKNKPRESGVGSLRDKIFFKKKTSLTRIKSGGIIIKNIVGFIVGFLLYIFKLFTDKEKFLALVNKIKSIPGFLKNKLQNFVQWFKGLSVRNKILFVVAVGSLFLFLQNLLVLNIKNNKIEEREAYTDLVKPIEQKQNQVEASLLYGNEDGARNLLSEITELLKELPRKTDKEIEQYNTFEEKHNKQLEKIRHVVKIENPKELANFVNLNVAATPINIALAYNNKIYSGDSAQKTIYTLNLEDNLITAIAGLDQKITSLRYPVLANSNNLYYLSGTNITGLDLETEDINLTDIDLLNGSQNITASANYNNRLYLFDKKENQIYRFNKRQSGFTERIGWVTSKVNLENTVSLSIDGHIYALKSNGDLVKLLKGERRDFDLDIIEPPIEEAKKVVVSPEQKFIYILEPSKQRLVIFDKTGDFLMQYKGDQFNDLRDFAVDENNKKIYFLNGTSIYEVDGVHFEE